MVATEIGNERVYLSVIKSNDAVAKLAAVCSEFNQIAVPKVRTSMSADVNSFAVSYLVYAVVERTRH